jgi:hypothetical protein
MTPRLIFPLPIVLMCHHCHWQSFLLHAATQADHSLLIAQYSVEQRKYIVDFFSTKSYIVEQRKYNMCIWACQTMLWKRLAIFCNENYFSILKCQNCFFVNQVQKTWCKIAPLQFVVKLNHIWCII